MIELIKVDILSLEMMFIAIDKIIFFGINKLNIISPKYS